MYDLLVAFFVFIVVSYTLDEGIIALIAAIFVFNIVDINIETNVTQTESVAEVITPTPKSNTTPTIPDGRITDKLRNNEEVDIFPIEGSVASRVCHANSQCFTTEDIRKHEGILYACNPDTIHCYKAKQQ